MCVLEYHAYTNTLFSDTKHKNTTQTQKYKKQTQEPKGPWRSGWSLAILEQVSFMPNCHVAEVTQIIMCYWCSRVLNAIPFHSTTRRFRVTCHSDTSALNDPKMTLNTTGSKRYSICVTNIHEFIVNKWHFTHKTLSTSPKFQYVLLYHKPFLSYKPFWDKCTEWPEKMTLNTTRSKVLHIYVTSAPSPKFQSALLYDQPLSNYR